MPAKTYIAVIRSTTLSPRVICFQKLSEAEKWLEKIGYTKTRQTAEAIYFHRTTPESSMYITMEELR